MQVRRAPPPAKNWSKARRRPAASSRRPKYLSWLQKDLEVAWYTYAHLHAQRKRRNRKKSIKKSIKEQEWTASSSINRVDSRPRRWRVNGPWVRLDSTRLWTTQRRARVGKWSEAAKIISNGNEALMRLINGNKYQRVLKYLCSKYSGFVGYLLYFH